MIHHCSMGQFVRNSWGGCDPHSLLEDHNKEGTRDSNFWNEEQEKGAKSRISNSQKLFGKI